MHGGDLNPGPLPCIVSYQPEEPEAVNKSQIIKVAIAVILLITAIVIIVSSLSGGGGDGVEVPTGVQLER